MRAPEKAGDIILRIFPPLLSDDGYRSSIQFRKAANDGQIVAKHPITMKFDKIGKNQLDQVKCSWTLLMTRQMHFLSCRYAGINLFFKSMITFLQAGDFIGEINALLLAKLYKLLNLFAHLNQRRFIWQLTRHLDPSFFAVHIQKLGKGRTKFLPMNHQVQLTMLHIKFCRLEILWQLLTNGLLDNNSAGKAKYGTWFSDVDITQTGETR
ncbi:hypothetical protein D3C76_1229640 [compost metagenome]